jgi:hypothetical protein
MVKIKIKILKDGENMGFKYFKDEIYEAKFVSGRNEFVKILNTKCLVTYKKHVKYGLECEILSYSNKIYELW